tara:strand:- start:60 stop:371 length:312 start_codon:yes stop_codon:yes gene_type:complete
MAKYHCPFCSPRYQIHKKRSDGVMICGQCGDPLIKISLIKPTQIFAILAATAFVAPLVLTAFAFIQDLNRSQPRKTAQFKSIPLREKNSFKDFHPFPKRYKLD